MKNRTDIFGLRNWWKQSMCEIVIQGKTAFVRDILTRKVIQLWRVEPNGIIYRLERG